jgi:TolA-binding protein
VVAVVRAQDARDEEDFRVAMGLVQRGMHDDAAARLRRFLDAQPKHPKAREAWYRLGVCCEELGQAEEAVASFGKALAGKGEFTLDAECRYRLGNVLKELRRFDDAQVRYRELVQGVPEDHYLAVPALYAEGECLRELGKLEAALSAFAAAAERAGSENGRYGMPALYQSGFVLMRLSRYDEARHTFAAAAERYPDHEAAAECRYLEGDAAFRGGDVKSAARAYTQARAAGGEFADDAVMGLAWCRLEEGDEAGALELFRSVVRDHAGSPHAHKARLEATRILYRTGDVDGALAELAPLLQDGVAPDLRVGAQELQGLALLDQGQADAAAASFARALGAATDEATRARLYYATGEALVEGGKWQEALAAYAEAASRAPDGALAGDVLYGESVALHKLGRYQEALAKARELLQRAPEHRLAGHASFAAGESLFALESFADADGAYAAVPAGHELAERAVFKRAWCAFLRGDMAGAARRFSAIAGVDGSAFAEEALSLTALAQLNAGAADDALATADRYRARYAEGSFLARTERVAAHVLRARGDLAGASRRLEVASKAEHAEEQVALDVVERAELQFQQGDFTGAQQLYAQIAPRKDRSGAQALEGEAWCAFELGDDAACLARVEAALAHPESAESRAALLELRLAALHRSKRWEEAVQTANLFLQEFAQHERAPEVKFGLGIAHARAENHAEARRVFAALAEAGGFARPDELYYEQAWACRRDGDEPAALAAFERVAEISKDPDRAGEANLHLGEAAAATDAARARECFARVRGKYRAAALYRTAFSWLGEGKGDRGLPSVQEILAEGEEQPLYLEALFLAGECHMQAGAHAEAARCYVELLDRAPEHERGQLARLHGGRCQVLAGEPGEAAALLEEYLQRDRGAKTERAEAQLWLGRARAARGEHDRAEVAYLETTNLSDGELAAEAQYRIGEVRQSKGDLTGAADAFVKLSILYGQEEWIRRGLLAAGLCYVKLEQPGKAAKFFHELAERFPDAPESEQARTHLSKLEGH